MNSQNSKKSNFPSNSSHNINNDNNSNRKVRKKNLRMKNLSPAKKFRLRLRLEKFQKRWQSREEYFEHDTRENLHLKRKKKRTKFYNNNDNNVKSKNYKKSKRAPKINTSLNTKFLQVAEKPPKTLKLTSKIDTIDSMAINSSLVTSHEISQRIIQNSEESKKNNHLSIYPTTSSDSMKCCCHCTCARSSSSTKRKPRRKLSSPYLGDFDILHINNNNHGNCPNAATKLTVMTTQQQQHKYVEATSSSDNFHKIVETPRLVKFLAHGFVEKKNTSVKRRFKNGKRFFILICEFINFMVITVSFLQFKGDS